MRSRVKQLCYDTLDDDNLCAETRRRNRIIEKCEKFFEAAMKKNESIQDTDLMQLLDELTTISDEEIFPKPEDFYPPRLQTNFLEENEAANSETDSCDEDNFRPSNKFDKGKLYKKCNFFFGISFYIVRART